MEYGEDIKSILEDNESIVWHGTVERSFIAFKLILSSVAVAFLSFPFFKNGTSSERAEALSGSTIGVGVIFLGMILSLLSFFSDYIKRYYITEKRVLIKSGIIGTDFNSIYLNKIRNANVSVGLMDKFFSIGTINIDTGKIKTVSGQDGKGERTVTDYDRIPHVSKPYEVYKYFQTALSQRQEGLYPGKAEAEKSA